MIWEKQFSCLDQQTVVIFRLQGYVMISHNGNGVNRKACWMCVLNKCNLQQSLPAVFLQNSWCESSQRGSPAATPHKYWWDFFCLKEREGWGFLSLKESNHIWSPPYLSKSDSDYRWVPQFRSQKVNLYHSLFYCGGVGRVPVISLSVGSGRAPCRPALLWALPLFSPSDSLFYFDCSLIRSSCTG